MTSAQTLESSDRIGGGAARQRVARHRRALGAATLVVDRPEPFGTRISRATSPIPFDLDADEAAFSWRYRRRMTRPVRIGGGRSPMSPTFTGLPRGQNRS